MRSFFFLFLVAFAFFSGAHHDYSEYQKQWALIYNGENPWLLVDGSFTGNAYGPTHILYGLFYWVHPNFAKVVTALSYLGIVLWFAKRYRSLIDRSFYFYFFSPFFLLSVFYYADLDTNVAFWSLSSLLFWQKRKDVLSGISLALAIGYKFFPIVYLPILLWSRGGKLRLKFAFSCLGTLSLLFASCFALWGRSVFYPLLYAGGREAKLLSIFRYLDGSFGPGPLFGISWQILSLPLMFISVSLVLFYHLVKKPSPLFGMILMNFALFLWYKLGHQQFYLSLAILYGYWFLENFASFKGNKRLVYSAVRFFVWLSVFTLLHKWMGAFSSPPWDILREWVGLIHFCLLVDLLWCSLGSQRLKPVQSV